MRSKEMSVSKKPLRAANPSMKAPGDGRVTKPMNQVPGTALPEADAMQSFVGGGSSSSDRDAK